MGRHRKKKKSKIIDSEEELNAVESGFEDCVDNLDEIVHQEDTCSKKRPLEESKNESSRKKGKYVKPITLEELSTYAADQCGQHSALLKMQLEEMLKEISIKEKHKLQINKWKNNFAKFAATLKTSKSYELSDLSWVKTKGLTLPLAEFSTWPKTKGTFIFCPPADVTFVGSFATNLITTHSRTIDIALVLPKEFMERKDLMNCRWILKRALYLCWLGKALKKSDLVEELSWSYQCGSPLRPVLQITPKGSLGKKWKFKIFPVPPENYFRFVQISPVKNNVRFSWFFEKKTLEGEDAMIGSSTPNYNWACAIDLLMMEQNKLIADALTYSEWKDGIKLLKIWFAQRHLNTDEGISSHVINLLVIYLIRNRKINLETHPYQVFRSTLLFFVKSDWCVSGPTLSKEVKPKDTNEVLLTVPDFHRNYPVVFVDQTGYFNFVANLFAEGFREIQQEAQKAIDFLESSSNNHFDCLFIQKIDFPFNYDQVLRISLTEEKVATIFQDHIFDHESELADHLGDKRRPVHKVLMSTLMKAFADRVLLVTCEKSSKTSFSFDETPEPVDYSCTLGISINLATFCSVITKGPSAESTDAKAFREFWGDVASMRRFQDSTFHEAILWCEPTRPVADRRLLLGKIAKYILKKHHKIQVNDILCIDQQLENAIRMPAYPEHINYGTGEEANAATISAFDTFSKRLRKLQLILPISSIQSSSEVLRHSQVFPPLSKAVLIPKKFIKNTSLCCHVLKNDKYGSLSFRSVIEAQIFLEISGKWPDDLLAIKAMKTKFLCQIHEKLQKEGTCSALFPAHLLISWEGFIFRVSVCYRREIYLNRIVDLPNGEYKEVETDASIALEKEIELAPRLTSSLNSLHSEFPSFSGSVRLAKRWCATQMLLPHLPPVVVDLLIAYLFVHPYPHAVPATPHVALLRFLKLLSSTDWRTTPILINFRKQLTEQDRAEITKRFNGRRDEFPAMFLASPFELRSIVDQSDPTLFDWNKRFRLLSCWSKPDPSIVVLNRAKSLSETALQWYRTNVYKNKSDFKTLFRPSIKDYDVVIYLHQRELSRRIECIDATNVINVQPYERTEGERLPVVQFDPAHCYLSELRENYDNQALFFFDDHGGDVIGVVWTPKGLQIKEAKVSSIKGHKLSGVDEVVQVTNIEAIIEDFKILGDGLVKEVKLKR